MTKSIQKVAPEAAIHIHEWGGANTHKARARGARSLARHLEQLEGPIVIVAHSHGGNVSRAALGFSDLEHDNSLLVTLGTPFLTVKERTTGEDLFVLGLAGVAVIAAVTLVVLDRVFEVGLMSWFVWLAWAILATAALLAVLYCYSLWSLWRAGLLSKKEDTAELLGPSMSSANLSAYATKADEAGLALAVSHFIGFLAGYAAVIHAALSLITYRFMRAMIGGLLMLLLILAGFLAYHAYNDSNFSDAQIEQTFGDARDGYDDFMVELREFVAESGIDEAQHSDGVILLLLAAGIALSVLLLVSIACLPAVVFLSLKAAQYLSTGFDSLALRHLSISASPNAPGAQHARMVASGSSSLLRHSSLTTSPAVCTAVAAEVQKHLDGVEN